MFGSPLSRSRYAWLEEEEWAMEGRWQTNGNAVDQRQGGGMERKSSKVQTSEEEWNYRRNTNMKSRGYRARERLEEE